MSSRHFQSGRAASVARRERVGVMCGEGSGGLARICSTRDFVTEMEVRKAASEWRSALRRLRPPRLHRKDAFNQDQWETGPPTMVSKVQRMALSNSAAVRWM